MAVATGVALAPYHPLPGQVVVGLLVLFVAGAISSRLPARRATGLLLALPGALLVADSLDKVPGAWTRPLVIAAVAGGGTLVADLDRRYRSLGYGPPLLALSVVGAMLTVPDTEHALALAGAAMPLALLAWPRPWASLGTAGSYAATGLFAWVVAFDGAARATSIIGGLGCLGLLLVEPVARTLSRGASPLDAADRLSAGWSRLVPVALVQIVVVLVSARVAGMRASASSAASVTAALLGSALVGAVALSRRKGQPRDSGG